MPTILIAMLILAAALSGPAEARPPIVVTDNDCANVAESDVRRGDTIILDTDLTVDSDGGDCILIAQADRVKLMLNGHTIDVAGDHGVRVEGSDKVQIRGPGRIRSFNTGLALTLGSSRALATGLIISDSSSRAISIEGSDNSQVTRNIIFNNLIGIVLTDESNNNRVQNNEIIGNTFAFGVRLENGASRNIVSGNNISANGDDGVNIDGTAGEGNQINDNIIVGNDRSDIDDNRANSGIGIRNNICETSDPPGLCDEIVPDFDVSHF